MKNSILSLLWFLAIPLIVCTDIQAQMTSAPLGTSTSSSSGRGPFQRSDEGSGSVFSRANLVYTQAEIETTLGITPGSTISQVNWDLGSTNIITASGDATMRVYMMNSTATGATAGQWTDIISGQTLVGTYTFNTAQNFPGSEGFLGFPLDVPFVYDGGTVEIAVEWDASGLIPLDPTNPNLLFSGNGSLNWHWTATSHVSIGRRAGTSSPPSEIRSQDLDPERVNTQFVYTPPASCMTPSNIGSTVVSSTSVDISWDAVTDASSYDWVVVASGSGPMGTAIASGTSAVPMVSITSLTSDCGGSLDFHVQSDCGGGDMSDFSDGHAILLESTTSAPLGTSTSSSSGRGPFQRSDEGSGSVFSRANLVYTQAEIETTLGITPGSTISQVNWDLGSTNIITASGDATMRVYMMNSTATGATAGQWTDIISGQTLVGTYTFNTAQNFPGSEGFLGFPLDVPFVYDGGTVEIAVEWDASGLIPLDPTNPNLLFSGNGSLNWHWTATSHVSIGRRAGTSSPPSEIRAQDLDPERVNTQFVFTLPAACVEPDNIVAANATATSIDVSWDGLSCADSYNWVVVESGAGPMAPPIVSGTATSTMVSITGLSTDCDFAYDFHVQSNCGGGDLSDYTNATILTLGSTTSTTLGTSTSSSSTRGPFQRGDTLSSGLFSRANMIYTQAEIASLGISNGATISQINWDLGSTNMITASGDATLRIYMRNSIETEATAGLWTDIISGQTLVGTYTFNQANNFPGSEGFLGFALSTPVIYDGGSMEIAVEWDASGLTSIHSNPSRLFSGNGSLNWHWTATSHVSLGRRSGSSSAPSEIRSSDLVSERVNTQFVFNDPIVCEVPTNLMVSDITTNSATLSWDRNGCAMNYHYIGGATQNPNGGGFAGFPVDTFAVIGGATVGLESGTEYRFFVQSQCGSGDFSEPDSIFFTTLCEVPTNLTSSNISMSGADLNWDAVTGASTYDWVVVLSGAGAMGTPVASGNSTMTTTAVTGLECETGYDFHVLSNCALGDVTDYSIAGSFTTAMCVGDCPDFLTINDQDIVTDVYQAGIAINSNGIVRIGSDVTFYAGDSIKLDPGFEVEDGGLFEADIQDCPTNP